MKTIHQNQTAEWSFTSSKPHKDPFNELELSARFTHANGEEKLVPAFWAGGKNWRVRFSSPLTGQWHFQTICSDPSDSGLHGQQGDFQVKRYIGSNPLYRHGPIRIAADKRHFEHFDGTPFFWLGDTWWMGLCKRLKWPKDFQTLAKDRVKKGFTLVQIVAGLYPDMEPFDKRGANEAGFPWEKDYTRINPAYFDLADRRIQHLVDSGLVPCIVACWGYFLPWMGVEKMKKHWRNLVARYGSYPTFWCLAGEVIMPYYLSTSKENDRKFQKKGWNELADYIREIDSYRRPITAHPGGSARKELGTDDASVLDFDMLQTGHGFPSALPNTIKKVNESRQRKPVMPVVEGEVLYEGIGGTGGYPQAQRWLFWACILNGAAGYTYGANGIWQVNTRKKPFGPSPHGMSWGDTPWENACQLLGSAHLALAKRLLERYDWWKLEPHPEWVEPGWTKELNDLPFTCGRHDIPLAAGIPGKIRIIYLPMGVRLQRARGIEKDTRYLAKFFNPITGAETKIGEVKPEKGNWSLPSLIPGGIEWIKFPIYQDWIIVLEAKREMMGGRHRRKKI